MIWFLRHFNSISAHSLFHVTQSSIDPSTSRMSLQEAFVAFASFGGAVSNEMDNAHFIKMCKECGLVDAKAFTTTDVDLLFNKIKAKGARKITFQQFQDGAIPEIAAKKKLQSSDVEAKICASSPKSSGTVAEATRFHDDKSQYTGVYKAGGPTNVDRNAGSLAGVVDRRVGNAVRGATTTQH